MCKRQRAHKEVNINMKAKKRLLTLAVSSAFGASVLGYFAIATKDGSFLGFADVTNHEISLLPQESLDAFPSAYGDGTATFYTVEGSTRSFTYTNMRVESNRFYMYSTSEKTSELRNSGIIIGSMRYLTISNIQVPSSNNVDVTLRWSWRDNAFVKEEAITFSSSTTSYMHNFSNELPSFFSFQVNTKDEEISFETLTVMFYDDDGGCNLAQDLTPVEPSAYINGLALELVDGEYRITGFDNSITELEIPESFNGVPLTSISANVFNGSNLTKISIPGSVMSIGDGALSNMRNLTEIELAEGIETIGDNAFMGCDSLTEISIPDTVTHLGANAFNGCSSLETIELSNSQTSVEEGTFFACESLESIIIPRSVTTIDAKVFQKVHSLNTIYIEHETPPAGFNNNWYKQANNAAVYYYSETQRAGYRHYVNGVPTLW